MSLIDRAATYRGNVVDTAVGVTTNGYPQLIVQFWATEIYDEETQQWVDWSEMAEADITAYLVLFDGKNQRTLNCQQVEKVFDWDGASFLDLNNTDYSEVKLQVRVEEHSYNDRVTLQVNWIDVYDAAPGKTVRKLDTDELKALQSKYSSILKMAGGKPKAAKAKTTKTTAKPKVPSVPETPAAGPPPTEDPVKIGKPKTYTKQQAWDKVVTGRAKGTKDDVLAQTWLKAVSTVAGNVPDAKVTGEQWYEIAGIVLDEVGDDIPF